MNSSWMDPLTAANQKAADPETLNSPPSQIGAAADLSPRLRDRRREKSVLSCTFCSTRKVRCDRQMPCKTCTDKDIGHLCTYVPNNQGKAKMSVGDRIDQLDKLVRALAQKKQQQTRQMPTMGSNAVAMGSQLDSSSQNGSSKSPQSISRDPGVATPLFSVDDDSILIPSYAPLSHSKDHEISAGPSPASSEYGSMRPHSHGAEYVGSAHWAAVLDSISELKDHYEEEEEARMLEINDRVPYSSPGPLLLYQPVNITKAEILASIPARPVVDRMIARYFFVRDTAPLPVLHSKQFLAEYESFWQDPTSVSLLWIGLLFGVMALTMQYQQLTEDPADPEVQSRVQLFRERTINCLVLGEYTRGKEYVIETLLHYMSLEVLLCKDADIGVWLVLGITVQLALSLGYHRDPRKFPKISPFAAEMRRRIWAVVVQTDLRLSSQMGFPRLLKLHQCDTAEPSNLQDSDFDETTTELPPSRPETEVTPTLSILAKNRIDHMSELVSNLLAETREHSYSDIMALDSKLTHM